MNIEPITITKEAKSIQITFPGFVVGSNNVTGRIEFFSELNQQGEILDAIEQPVPEEVQANSVAEIAAWLLEQNNIVVIS